MYQRNFKQKYNHHGLLFLNGKLRYDWPEMIITNDVLYDRKQGPEVKISLSEIHESLYCIEMSLQTPK